MTKEEKDDIINLSEDVEMEAVALSKHIRAVEDARRILERARGRLDDYMALLVSKDGSK